MQWIWEEKDQYEREWSEKHQGNRESVGGGAISGEKT
jgi:hypothetical protein